MGNVVVGVCCRLPDQKEVVDEAFRQLEEASHSQAVVLVGDFNHLDICQRGNTVGHKPSRRLLEHIDDHFLTQRIEELMTGDILLDLITYKQGRTVWGCEGQ